MIIDCDTHFMPKDAFDYVEGNLSSRRPFLKFDDRGALVDVDFPGKPPMVQGTTPTPAPGSGAHYAGIVDIEERLNDYKKMGIDQQFILPQLSGWWSYLIEPPLALAVARSWNISLLKLMHEYPGKIQAVALVALQDVEGSIRELEWAYEQGFKAIVLDQTYPVREHPYGETMGSHRELWPFFQKAEELDFPLFLHPIQHGHRIVNLLNFQKDGLDIFAPRDAQMNLASLITSGLLDDFPRLKFIQAETGTKSIKFLARLMDSNFKQAAVDNEGDEGPSRASKRRLGPTAQQLVPPEVANEKNKRPPSHYFKNNFYWTIETEEPELVEAIDFLGADRFFFATDYPHDDPGGRMKFKDVELLAVNAKISESDKDLIRFENAKRVFKIS